MNQHFPSRKTFLWSGPASSPAGQCLAAGPLPGAQQHGADRAPGHSRGAARPGGLAADRRNSGLDGCPVRSSAFRFPTRGLFPLLATPFLPSAVPAGAAPSCALPGPGHGEPCAENRLRDSRGISEGHSRRSAALPSHEPTRDPPLPGHHAPLLSGDQPRHAGTRCPPRRSGPRALALGSK